MSNNRYFTLVGADMLVQSCAVHFVNAVIGAVCRQLHELSFTSWMIADCMHITLQWCTGCITVAWLRRTAGQVVWYTDGKRCTGWRDCVGLLAKLCDILMASGVPADVLTETINTVAEVIRGNQYNQDYFASVMAPSSPPRYGVVICFILRAVLVLYQQRKWNSKT